MKLVTAIEKAVGAGYKDFPFLLMKNPDTVFVRDGKIQAIKKEGEWDTTAYIKLSDVVANPYKYLLDPLFWAALGRSEGWEKPETYWTMQSKENAVTLLDAWECNMHSLLQELITASFLPDFDMQRTIEDYFKSLN